MASRHYRGPLHRCLLLLKIKYLHLHFIDDERIPKETIVITWESHYHMADGLIAEGFRIINGSRQPLDITPGFNYGRWCARDIYEWDVYNLQHWWEHSAATVNPVHLPPHRPCHRSADLLLAVRL